MGIIELPSGKWDWSAFRSASGTTIVLRHWTRYEEEMRTWIPGLDPTIDAVEAAARDAILRVWVDGFGSRWQVGLEQIRTAQSSYREGETGRIWLVFARGTRKARVAVPVELRLGELTPVELARLLAVAEAGLYSDAPVRNPSGRGSQPVRQGTARLSAAR